MAAERPPRSVSRRSLAATETTAWSGGGSAKVGIGASQVVPDLLAHARVNVVLGEIGRLGEANAVGLVVDRGGAADGAANVGVLVLLADLAVGVGDDVVRWCRRRGSR